MSTANEETQQDANNNDGWGDLDDIDYGDDDDQNDDEEDEIDGIGDLDLSDDDDEDNLPPDDAMSSSKQIKYEISSTLNNPNRIGISYKLELDAKETPADISDDDETAPNLKINHFQLITSQQNNGYSLHVYHKYHHNPHSVIQFR